MSLIQDALKRQQEESGSSQVPLKAAAAPSVPANRPLPDAMPVPPSPEPANRPLPDAMPVPPSPPATPGVALRAGLEKPVQPGKSWKRIAGIIILCVLIAWSGGLLVVLILKQSAERTLLGLFMPDLTHGRVTLGKSSVQAPPPAAQPPATTMSKPMVTPAPARASASRPFLSPAAAAAPAFADKVEEDVEEDVALPSVNKQELPVTVPSPVPVVWPRLKLSAIFSNVGSGQSGARLNNRLVLLGDQINGVTLVEIRQDSVVLKCGKETRSLKMGMTLN